MTSPSRALLAEPGLYSFSAGDSDDAQTLFNRFWNIFKILDEFVELNAVRVLCSREIFEAAQRLFPYAALSSPNGPGIHREASGLLERFLDRYVQSPWLDYAGAEDRLSELAPLADPRTGVYANEDMWLAWQDLLAQAITADRFSTLILSSEPPFSFVPADASEVTARFAIGDRVLVVGRVAAEGGVREYLDPRPYRSLLARIPEEHGDPDIDYEDSGHTPPQPIRKVLERTAKDVPGLVLRMLTTYRWPGPETCRLQQQTEGQVSFTVSDGHLTFRGYFTTRAVGDAELRTATALLSVAFHRRCEQEHFVVRG